MSRKLEIVTARVQGCPRCMKHHRGVVFTQFRRPVYGYDGGVWSYEFMGRCPNTLAPILGRRDIQNFQLTHFI